MADDEELNLDGDSPSGAPAKKGGVSNLLPNLLKWIVIGLAAIIVIVVVSVITVKIVNKNSSNATISPINLTDDYSGPREEYDWYKSIGTIQTFTNDEPPATVRVNVYLGYKKDDKATSAEITNRQVELKSNLRRYFKSKTAAELKNVNNEEKFFIEIKNLINDKVLSNSKIRAVEFDEISVVEPN